MNIRGILSEKVNWLERQWELGSYGNLSKLKELTEYQNRPPAVKLFGEIKILKNSFNGIRGKFY